MKQGIIIAMIVAALAVAGVIGYVGTRGGNQKATTNKVVDKVEADGTIVKPDGTMVKPDGTMIKPDGTMIKPDGTMIGPDGQVIEESTNTNSTNTNTASSKATYIDYSSAALAAAQATGRTVLYFHAPWCPICVVLEPQIKAQIGTFPGDVTILKVDYDSSTELKKKYGVTYQHTFVQVDSQGHKLKIWSGGDVGTIKQNII